MSDRGLPIVDGATACPFVAFEDDRDERATSPDPRHRCYAEIQPAPRALAHQEAYCLASTFPVCPTFQDWARRESAHARDRAAASEPPRYTAAPERHEPRDWSAPPPWAAGAADAAAAGVGLSAGAADDDFDEGDDRHGEPPGFLASRSAAVAGAGLAGSAADRLAGARSGGDAPGVEPGHGAPADDERRRAAREALAVSGVDPVDDDAEFDDEFDDDEFETGPLARPRSARASGGIGFGRDRRPRVGDTRRTRSRDDAGPSWERPRHQDAYPTLKTRMGLPSVSRVGAMAIALVIAAIALFFLPGLLGIGGSPGTGTGATPTPGASAPAGSVDPTAVPGPTPRIYIVKAGDSMSKIATLFGVSLDDLIAANRELHPNPDQLQIGDQVIIPDGPSGSGSPSPAPS